MVSSARLGTALISEVIRQQPDAAVMAQLAEGGGPAALGQYGDPG
jgi:hypothetical protein